MVNIRKQYAKLKIDLLKDIEKVISNQKHDYNDQTYRDIRDYKCCIVGTVRHRLGLGNDYECGENYCSKCIELANEFPNPIEIYKDALDILNNLDNQMFYRYQYERDLQINKEKYEALLIELKQHLVLVHKKRIDV